MTCQFLYDSVSTGLNLMPCDISWGPDLSKEGISISTGSQQPGGYLMQKLQFLHLSEDKNKNKKYFNLSDF